MDINYEKNAVANIFVKLNSDINGWKSCRVTLIRLNTLEIWQINFFINYGTQLHGKQQLHVII